MKRVLLVLGVLAAQPAFADNAIEHELVAVKKSEPAPLDAAIGYETAPVAPKAEAPRSVSMELEQLQEIFSAIQDDLKVMAETANEVVQTTTTIGRMMMKMRQIEAKDKQRPISDNNLAVDPKGQNLEKLRLKFEDFKDEHWSRFAIPNFEYRFFKRDRDLVTVTNPGSLKKIIQGISQARAQFMPAGCFDRVKKTFNASAPVCQKRASVCGQAGFESQENQLVAYQVNPELRLEAQFLSTPEDAERVLGNRYDTTSDRSTMLSDEIFYFCKLASRFGATFKAEPFYYPAEVAAATVPAGAAVAR